MHMGRGQRRAGCQRLPAGTLQQIWDLPWWMVKAAANTRSARHPTSMARALNSPPATRTSPSPQYPTTVNYTCRLQSGQ